MSLVRLECETYYLTPEIKELASKIWPELANPEDKYPACKPVFMDIDDIPDWVGEARGVNIKPLQKIRFERPSPNLNTGDPKEIREFLKTVNQIVMPGFELLKYGAIKVETDSCTMEIQKDLDDGWRIIAVLPQPQQRRPDYILVRESKS